MRLYGKRFMNNSTERAIAEHSETRDAVVWDVITADRICRVKIQGSDEYIIAHYPENWEQIPSWLKVGNSVRIIHRGGVRGKVEVVGHGQTLPTPVTGQSVPNTPQLPNALIEGCEVIEIPTGAQMAVMVKGGTYRYSGDTKIVPCINMVADSVYDMTMAGNMGDVIGVFAITAPTLNYRVDRVVLSAAGVVSYLVGTASNTTVVPQAIPRGGYSLATIFVRKGVTAIYQSDINTDFSDPEPTLLEVTPAKSALTTADTTTTIVVRVIDQYGNYLDPPSGGWRIKGTITSGTGLLSAPYIVGSISGTSVTCYMRNGLNTFTYSRVSGTEVSPQINFELLNSHGIQRSTMLGLLDASGNYLV